MTEELTILPDSDLEFLRVRYGIEALSKAVDLDKVEATIKPIVEAYVAAFLAGDRFNQAVVKNHISGWIVYRD